MYFTQMIENGVHFHYSSLFYYFIQVTKIGIHFPYRRVTPVVSADIYYILFYFVDL